MDEKEMSANLQVSITTDAPFWNWSRIHENEKISNKDNMDEEVKKVLTYVWIVSFLLVVSLLIYIHHKYLKENRLENLIEANGFYYQSFFYFLSMKRKDTPPPYEDPPSYEVAIQLEKK